MKILRCLAVVLAVVMLNGYGLKNAAEADGTAVIAKAEHKDIEFRITKAEIVNTEEQYFNSSEMPRMKLDGYLLLVLELINNGKSNINYVSSINGGSSLVDNNGSRYYRIHTEEMDDDNTLIYPGESTSIILSFQKPAPMIESVTLSFPKRSIWGFEAAKREEVVKINVPVEKISVREEMVDKTVFNETIIGEKLQLDHWTVRVTKAKIGRAEKTPRLNVIPDSHYFEDRQEFDNAGKDEVTIISISCEFTNRSSNKKMEFTRVHFELADNVDNKYKELSEFYKGESGETKPEYFPSIYPGESYVKESLFQPPVSGVKELILTIDASKIGIENKIRVLIPIEKVKNK